jgi:hypothetical protein
MYETVWLISYIADWSLDSDTETSLTESPIFDTEYGFGGKSSRFILLDSPLIVSQEMVPL